MIRWILEFTVNERKENAELRHWIGTRKLDDNNGWIFGSF